MAGLTDEQWALIKRTVAGRHVIEFGCGDGALTRTFEQDGALSALGVDKNEYAMKLATQHLGTELTKYVCRDYEEFVWDAPSEFDLGVVSWPVNKVMPALVQLIQRCKTVIYIGKNTDATASGGRDLIEYLSQRKVVEYVPAFLSVVCVYGEETGITRAPTGDEFGGLSMYRGHPSYTWEQAETIAKRMGEKFAELEALAIAASEHKI